MAFPSFASGDVLNASDMNAVGLWLVKTQTIGTGVTTVTVSGAFSSTYDNYRIVVNIDSINTGGPYATLQLGSTTTGYYYGMAGAVFSTAAASLLSTNNGANWNRLGPVNTTGSSFVVDLLNPNRALRTVIYSNYADFNTAGSGGNGSGFLNDTTQYTAFTLGLTTAATMTGGNIRVYGYRN